jgi:hypothetical protein
MSDAELWELLQNELPAGPKLEDVRLTFSFRYQPWEDVLNWVADEAGLSLWYETLPQGTCNYVDDRQYTLPQALDVLNGLLLFKGYTLVRRERLLVVADVDDLEGGIPPNLLSIVPAEELDHRGEYELITTVFQLENLSTEEAEAEIKDLVVPPGSIIPMPKARQLVVTETAARLRMIRDALERIEAPGGLASRRFQSFPLDFTLAEDVLAILRQLFDIPDEENAAPDGSIRLILDPMGMRLIAFGEQSKLDQVAQVLEALDTPMDGDFEAQGPETALQLEVYRVAPADPETALSVAQTLLQGSPGARLSTDGKTGNLIALARPEDHATLRATLEQMRDDSGTVEVIQLRSLDPQLAVLSITKLFGGGENSNLKVDADVTSRRLVIRGPQAQVEQVTSWLEQMGEGGTAEPGVATGGNVRMVPLSGWAAKSALERLQEIWPVMRNNKIRVVTPSAVIPTLRASERAGALSPEEALLEELFGAGFSGSPPVGAPARLGQPTPQPSEAAEPDSQPSTGDPPTAPSSQPVPSAQSPPAEAVEPQAKSASAGRSHAAARARVVFASETLTAEPSPGDSETPAAGAPTEAPIEGQQPTDAPPEQPAQTQSPIVVAPGPGGIMIASEDLEALDDFEDLLSALASGALAGTSDLTVFYLVHAKATAVAETLDPILGGGTLGESGSGGGSLLGDLAGAAFGDAGALVGSMLGVGGGSETVAASGSIQIIPDARLNALIVRASPNDTDTIR